MFGTVSVPMVVPVGEPCRTSNSAPAVVEAARMVTPVIPVRFMTSQPNQSPVSTPVTFCPPPVSVVVWVATPGVPAVLPPVRPVSSKNSASLCLVCKMMPSTEVSGLASPAPSSV